MQTMQTWQAITGGRNNPKMVLEFRLAEAEAFMATIRTELQKLNVADPNWDHVGSAAHVVEKLEQARNFLTGDQS